MRISIVPAQITTVEDKITGNLSVQQAAYIGVPMILALVMTISFPPSGQIVAYKIAISVFALIVGGILAIRIKDRIIAQWIILLARYYMRPQYFVYDKRTTYLRKIKSTNPIEVTDPTEQKTTSIPINTSSNLKVSERIRLENYANNPAAQMKFKVGKKGKLNVYIKETD